METRLQNWLNGARLGAESDIDIVAGLGNGDIDRPEWMGRREESNGVWVWDSETSDGTTGLVWLGE